LIRCTRTHDGDIEIPNNQSSELKKGKKDQPSKNQESQAVKSLNEVLKKIFICGNSSMDNAHFHTLVVILGQLYNPEKILQV